MPLPDKAAGRLNRPTGATVRVIAGQYRGRSLAAPPGLTTRPITDRVKETLFNILGHRFALPGELPAFAVLDLFSGPGSLGLEALSRGAAACTFVERDRAALRCLRQNITTLQVGAAATIRTDNAWTMRPPQPPAGFGLIFVDPPYRETEDPWRVLDLLERLAPSLSPDGVLVFRQAAQTPSPVVQSSSSEDRSSTSHKAPVPDSGSHDSASFGASPPRGLHCIDERIIGQMRLLFLARAK